MIWRNIQLHLKSELFPSSNSLINSSPNLDADVFVNFFETAKTVQNCWNLQLALFRWWTLSVVVAALQQETDDITACAALFKLPLILGNWNGQKW